MIEETVKSTEQPANRRAFSVSGLMSASAINGLMHGILSRSNRRMLSMLCRSNALAGLIMSILLLSVITGCGDGDSPIEPGQDFATLTLEYTEVLSSPPIYARDSQVTISPTTGEIFCCWCRDIGEGTEVVWRRGTPGSFSVEEPITEVDDVRSWNPSLLAGPDGRVHFAYMDQKIDGKQKEIYAKTWTDGVWGPEKHLSLYDGWTGWDPDVAVYPDGRPVVCWFDHRFGVQHEILLRIGDGLGFWWPDVRLTNDHHWQYFPDIEIDSRGVVHLSYVDTREIPDEWEDPDHYAEGKNLEIYYRQWNGDGPGPEVRLTNTGLRSIASQITVDRLRRAHVIWLDESSAGYYRLYYTNVDAGAGGGMHEVSDDGTRADLSSIASLGNRVFAAYSEYTDPYGSTTSECRLSVREILPDGRTGTPTVLASSGTNLHSRIAADELRDMLWVIWMEYTSGDEMLIEGESRIHLAGIRVTK